MKNLKKLTAVLLLLAMMVGLCACGADDSAKLVGTWTYDFDLSVMMEEELESSLGDSLEVGQDLIMPLVFTFNEDKTFSLSIDADATTDSLNVYVEALTSALVEYMYKMGEDSGMDRDTFAAAMQEAYGMSLEDYCSDLMSSLDVESLVETMDQEDSGYFKAKDGKLYFAASQDGFSDDEYYAYTLEGSTLTFTEMSGDPLELDDLDISYPMELVKK